MKSEKIDKDMLCSLKQLSEVILDLREGRTADDLIDSNIRVLCKHAAFVGRSPPIGSELTRQRAFLNEDEIATEGCWYPKKRPDLPEGRFNETGQSMAYFCENGATARNEIFNGVESDCHVLVALIKKEGLKLLGVFPLHKPMKFEENHFCGSLEQYIEEDLARSLPPKHFKKMCMVTEFIGQQVSDPNANRRITNAISRELLKLNPEFGGIIYASTKSKLASNNVVMKPEVADEFLRASMLFGYKRNPNAPGAPYVTDVVTYSQTSMTPIQWINGYGPDGFTSPERMKN
jgi:hypothetical protein